MSELELFIFLRDRHLPDLERSVNPFARFDCSSQSARLHIELKCRRSHYDTLLIEKNKFDNLIARSKQLQFSPCYINSTPQGIFAFNLLASNIQWQSQSLPATTDFQNSTTIEKVVGFLPISEAIQLTGGG
jgi:hypothetical protein